MRARCIGWCVACFVIGAVRACLAEEVAVGEMAPDFELTGSDGELYRLSDFRDQQAVVIAWFPRAFTGGCTAECKALRDGGELLRAYDVAYFAASCDPVERNADFARSLELDYPILSDPDGTVARAYGVHRPGGFAKRWTFIIGPDGHIQHIERRVRIRSHAEDLAAKLAELGIPRAQ